MTADGIGFTIVLLCVGITMVASKTTFYPLKFFAGIAWWGLAAYWIAVPFTTAGSPPHVIILVFLMFVGLMMIFMPFWFTRTDNGVERGRFRLPFMSEDEQEEISQSRSDRIIAYQDRLNNASRGERTRPRGR